MLTCRPLKKISFLNVTISRKWKKSVSQGRSVRTQTSTTPRRAWESSTGSILFFVFLTFFPYIFVISKWVVVRLTIQKMRMANLIMPHCNLCPIWLFTSLIGQWIPIINQWEKRTLFIRRITRFLNFPVQYLGYCSTDLLIFCEHLNTLYLKRKLTRNLQHSFFIFHCV